MQIEPSKEFTKRNEGLRLDAYQCPTGYWTIGYGHNIEANGLTITKEKADELFDQDYGRAMEDADKFLDGNLDALDEVRKAAVVDMAFQMGLGSLRSFVNTKAAILRGDWSDAAERVLLSLYARQTPSRARRISQMLRTGEW